MSKLSLDGDCVEPVPNSLGMPDDLQLALFADPLLEDRRDSEHAQTTLPEAAQQSEVLELAGHKRMDLLQIEPLVEYPANCRSGRGQQDRRVVKHAREAS